MKNLLKLTGGLAVAGILFASSITSANANTETVALEDITVANEDITVEMRSEWWAIVSSDYVVAGGGSED